MLKNAVECLLKTKPNDTLICKDLYQQIFKEYKFEEENLIILKKFEKICKNQNKFSLLALNKRNIFNFIFNLKFLLGLVSAMYMFCIVFTFFVGMYYEFDEMTAVNKSDN